MIIMQDELRLLSNTGIRKVMLKHSKRLTWGGEELGNQKWENQVATRESEK